MRPEADRATPWPLGPCRGCRQQKATPRSGTIPAPTPVSGGVSRSRGLVVENSRRSEREFRTLERRQSHSSSQFHRARALASPSGQGIGLTHRHSQVRVLERAPRFSPVAQWQSARPITGRPAVRYRAGEPATQAIADGPGAFKPETVGQRAFNPRARGSTPPGSSNHTVTCTRLAQLVRAPSS